MIRPLYFLMLVIVACGRLVAQPELLPILVENARAVEQLVQRLADRRAPDLQRIDAAERLALLNVPATVPALIDALDDPMFAVRLYAARALGCIGDRAAVPALIAHMQERDPEAHLEIVTALGRLADPRAVEVLAPALQHPNEQIQLAATLALGRIPGAISALLALARRGDQAVALALAEVGDPAATEALAGLFTHDDIEIRKAAGLGLARIGTEQAITKLLTLIEECTPADINQESWQVWQPAFQLLAANGGEQYLLPLLADESYHPRQSVAISALSVHEECDAALVYRFRQWLNARQPTAAIALLHHDRMTAEEAYLLAAPRPWRDSEQLDGLLGPRPPLIAFSIPRPARGSWVIHPEVTALLLGGETPARGRRAGDIRQAGFTGDHAVGQRLRDLIAQEYAAPTENHASMLADYGYTLWDVGDPCAIPALLQMLANPGAQHAARMGLASSADGRHAASYQLLREHLTDANAAVRQGAAVGLGSCRDARAVPDLLQVLQTDAVPEVREFAALALGLIGDTRAVPAPCAALGDPVEWARSAAAWALGEIGDLRALQPLQAAAQADRNRRFQVRAYHALYWLGDRGAAAQLAEFLTDGDGNNRSVAYAALLDSDAPEIAGSLLAQLAQVPNSGVIRALGRQRNPQAIPVLLTILAESLYSYAGNYSRAAAAWALGMVGEGQQGAFVAEAAEALYRAACVDADPAVRAAAGLALARLDDPRAPERLAWIMQRYLPERNAAIRALWRSADPQATALLVAALQDDDPLGQVLAAYGLYLRGDPRGRAALTTLVTTVTEPVAKQVAIRYAAELQEAALLPFFIQLTQAQHEEASIFLVLEAIGALGRYAAREATQALIPLLDSPASRIREAAALALHGTRNAEALAALRACLATEEATRVRAAIQAIIGE